VRLLVLGLLGVLGGCNFRHGELCSTCDDAPTGSNPDALPIDTPVDMAIDAPKGSAAPFCDPADTTLAGCWEFEGNTNDGTGHGMSATNTGATYVTGRTGMAVHIDANTALDVTENVAMDVTSLTIEAWIHAAIPASGRSGILDNNNQYGFFIYAGPFFRCIGFDQNVTLVANTWTHVACTYDGTVRVYVDGVKVGENGGGGGALSTAATTGLTLGDDNPAGGGDALLGDLDQVRLYNVARTPTQICQDAGLAICP